jgi:hypothetical protein
MRECERREKGVGLDANYELDPRQADEALQWNFEN